MPVTEQCDGLSLNRGSDPPGRVDRSLSGREPRNHPKQEGIDPPKGGIDPFLAAMKNRSRNSFFLNLTKACPWKAIQRHQNNPKHMRGRKQDSYQDIYGTKSSMKDSIIHKMIKWKHNVKENDLQHLWTTTSVDICPFHTKFINQTKNLLMELKRDTRVVL